MKKQRIKLSIIIPVFRVEKYLKKCIDALIDQLQPCVEIILVDDGSDDYCPIICDEYSKRYKEIKTIHKKNGGLSSAVKEGISYSTGEYIGFCDSDDWVEKDYIKEIIKVIDENDIDVIYFDYFRVYESSKKIVLNRNNLITPGKYEGETCELLKRLYLRGIPPMRWNKVIKRELVEHSLKYYDLRSRIGEDILFTAPIIYSMNTFYYIDKVLINYNINEASMTQNFDKSYLDDFNLIVKVLSEYFNKDMSFLGNINYINMRTFINAVGKSTLQNKWSYLKSIFGKQEMKDRLNWVNKDELSMKDKVLLYFMKKNYCSILLFISFVYRKLYSR